MNDTQTRVATPNGPVNYSAVRYLIRVEKWRCIWVCASVLQRKGLFVEFEMWCCFWKEVCKVAPRFGTSGLGSASASGC